MLFPSCGICWFMHLLLYFSPVFYLPPTLICRLHEDKFVFSTNLYLEPGTELEHRNGQLSINLINIHDSYSIRSIINQFGDFRSGKPGYIMSRYQAYHKAGNSCISSCGQVQICILIFKFQILKSKFVLSFCIIDNSSTVCIFRTEQKMTQHCASSWLFRPGLWLWLFTLNKMPVSSKQLGLHTLMHWKLTPW